MVLKNTPLKHPLDHTIYLFGLRIYRDTRFFNNRQGLAPLPLFHIAYEMHKYRLVRGLLFREHSMHSRIFHVTWI